MESATAGVRDGFSSGQGEDFCYCLRVVGAGAQAPVNEGAGSGLMPHVRLQISEHFPNRKEEGPSWIKTRGV